MFWDSGTTWDGGVTFALGVGESESIRSRARSPLFVTYEGHANAKGGFTKAAGEVLDFDIEFASELASTADDARSISPISTLIPAGITLVDAYWVADTGCVKLWFSGGEDRKKYPCTVWLNTRDGRRLESDVLVRVKG